MEQKVRVELTNERFAVSYPDDERLLHIQDSGAVTAIEPRFITPFDSVIIINLIGMLSLLKLTSYFPIKRVELLLKKHISCTSLSGGEAGI